MKALEAYLKEHYDTHRGDMHYDPSCEQGWRAALEWVKQELCPGNGKAEILEDIEKELEDNGSVREVAGRGAE